MYTVLLVQQSISIFEISAFAHNIILTPPLFIEVPVPRQESERSSICVLRVLILHFYAILIFDFEIVPTVWYFFCFSFHFWTQFMWVSTLILEKTHTWVPRILVAKPSLIVLEKTLFNSSIDELRLYPRFH